MMLEEKFVVSWIILINVYKKSQSNYQGTPLCRLCSINIKQNALFSRSPTPPSFFVNLRPLSSQFGAECLLFKSCLLKSMTMRGCLLMMDWMECLRPTWPHLELLSLQDSAKTNDRDLQYMIEHNEWKTTLRCGVFYEVIIEFYIIFLSFLFEFLEFFRKLVCEREEQRNKCLNLFRRCCLFKCYYHTLCMQRESKVIKCLCW